MMAGLAEGEGENSNSGASANEVDLGFGLKRRDPFEGVCGFLDSPAKKARCDSLVRDVEVRLLIPSDAAGIVIGPRGCKITRLRQEYDANITIPECQGPERLIKIIANDDVILSILYEVMKGFMDHNREKICEIRLIFPEDVIGGIIGKGGANIQQLRALTKTTIKVFSNLCPKSLDRIVLISGDIDDVQNASRQILDGVNENSKLKLNIFRNKEDQYDPNNYRLVPSRVYGGYGDGPNRWSALKGLEIHRRIDDFPRDSGSRIYNNSRRIRPDWYGYGEKNSESHRDHRSSPSSSRGAGGAGRAHPEFPEYDEHGQPMERITTQYTIPNQLVGALIGHKGFRIRRTREECGADIAISGPGEGGAQGMDRVITVTGTPGQIKYAAYLLQQSVKSERGSLD